MTRCENVGQVDLLGYPDLADGFIQRFPLRNWSCGFAWKVNGLLQDGLLTRPSWLAELTGRGAFQAAAKGTVMTIRNRNRLTALVTAGMLAAAGAGWAAPLPGEGPTQPEVPKETPKDQYELVPAPAGFVMVEEGLWAQHHDQPAREFHSAYDEMLRNDQRKVAASLRRAAGYLRAEMSHAETGQREQLATVVGSITELADRISNGEAVAPADLKQSFAHASHVLASHHLALARRAAAKKDAFLAGSHLEAAVTNRYEELTWEDRELDDATQDAMNQIAEMAEYLQKDGATVNWETTRALDDLDRLLGS
jgi:hypothetical protein